MRLIEYEDLLACLAFSVMDEGCYTLPNMKMQYHECPTVNGARGFGNAHAYGEDGALVASFAQESLLREKGE